VKHRTLLTFSALLLAGLGAAALLAQAPASGDSNPLTKPPAAATPASTRLPLTPPSSPTTRSFGAPTNSSFGTTKNKPAITPVTASAPTPPKKTIEVTDALVTLIDDVRVPAQEAGRLMKLHVKGNELVDEGFVLAEIDNRDTQAKKKIAEGEVAVATAQAESTAEIEVAEKAIEVSKAEYDSNVDIRKKNPGAVSETELRKYLFQWQRALAQLKVAQTDHYVAELTTKVKAAQMEATDNELARRQAAAPFKGEVNEVYRQVGEWVQPGDPLVHLVRFDQVRVKGFVYAKTAAPVDVIGKPVEIKVVTAGGKEETVKGKVNFASSIIEGVGDTRQFRIWADVDNRKVVDPVTKQESWAIQSGASATIVVDITPPPPAPKVNTFKPVIDPKKPAPKER
jgi:multidrug efflux pump subunit AcrA (membrane-fusion protein)